MKNHSHDLIHQLSEMLDSVWRIDRHYLGDAKTCSDECVKIWENLRSDLQKQCEILQESIKKHCAEDNLK
ncbi:MAG: hypothetical protein AAB560_01120 [Patescibacteria group bacterium]